MHPDRKPKSEPLTHESNLSYATSLSSRITQWIVVRTPNDANLVFDKSRVTVLAWTRICGPSRSTIPIPAWFLGKWCIAQFHLFHIRNHLVYNIEHWFRQDLLERTSPKWMGNDSTVPAKLALESITGIQRLKLIQPISRDGDIIPPRRHC